MELYEGLVDLESGRLYASLEEYPLDGFSRRVGILLHRDTTLRGEYEAFRILKRELEKRDLGCICAFSGSGAPYKSFRQVVDLFFRRNGTLLISALVSGQILPVTPEEGRSVAGQSILEFSDLDIPVFSPVQAFYVSRSEWEEKNQPLREDISSWYTVPEMSGMIEPVLISTRNQETGEVEVLPDQISRLAGRINGWIRLREKENREKRVVLMLHNAVCSGAEATIGKAYGLDSLESAVGILNLLKDNGYRVEDIPRSGEELLALFHQKKAYSDFRWTAVEDIVENGGCLYRMGRKEYDTYYRELPEDIRSSMEKTWGPPPGEGMVLNGDLLVPGLSFGNVLVMIQPKRGCYGAKCTGEVCKILHDPLCPPPHQYLAVYRFIQRIFQADACVDVGTEGNLEFLPGKTNGLSERCWPRIIAGDLPLLYIYHAGVPGEATVAKRRAHTLLLSYLPSALGGLEPEEEQLLRKAEEYLRSVEEKNGQEELIFPELKKALQKVPAAVRILDHSSSFMEGIREIVSGAALVEREGRKGRLHVYGENPDGREMTAYEKEADTFPKEMVHTRLLKTGQGERQGLLKALEGRYVPPSESGMPDENGLEILPTGRNLCGIKEKDFPGKVPYRRGMDLARQLLEEYKKEKGELPQKVALNMISLDITRTGGEQLSEFLYLCGVRPVWDQKERVRGLEVIPLTELGRPRIDVTVRISGVLRDTWPGAVRMMDEAVQMVAVLPESPEDNYLRRHMLEYRSAFGDSGDGEETLRIFGDPPGGYGTGVDLALKASAWQDEKDLARYFVQSSAFAYGKDLEGERKVRAFARNMATVQAASDVIQSKRIDLLSSDFSITVQGGMSLAARFMGGQDVKCFEGFSEKDRPVKTEELPSALEGMAQETLLNPFWREDRKEEGSEGASEIMCRIQNLFAAQCLLECVPDSLLDQVTETFVNDPEMRQWLKEKNLYAAEEIARRMLELHQREKWKPDEQVLSRLKESYLEIEGDMEGSLESRGEIQAGEVEIVTHRDQQLWQENLRDVEEWIP